MRKFLIALLLLAGCAAEQPAADSKTTTAPSERPAAPSPGDAQTLIANAPELGEYQFTEAGWTAPVSGAAMSEPLRAEAKQLAAAGWIAIDNNGDISLTDKSRNDKRFLLRPNGLLDIVPLAKKEFGKVLAVRDRDGVVTVDFTWRWLPNEVGQALTSGLTADRYAATDRKSTAELAWDGTRWTIVQIK